MKQIIGTIGTDFVPDSPVERSDSSSKKIYPKRLSASVDEEIQEIEDILSGKTAVLELSPEDRTELLVWENSLCEDLEKIYDLKVSSESFCPQYFLTEDGLRDWQSLFPDLARGENIGEISATFYQNTQHLKNLPEKVVDEVCSRSIKFFDHHLEDQLVGGLRDDGSMGITSMDYLDKRTILLNPENGAEKLRLYRKIRKQLRAIIMETKTESGNLPRAKAEVACMYQAKINEMQQWRKK